MSLVSMKLSALLGKRVVITRDFAGYPSGSFATVEQFCITAEDCYFLLLFESIPASVEQVSPLYFASLVRLLGSDGVELSVKPFFQPGPPPKKSKKYDLAID